MALFAALDDAIKETEDLKRSTAFELDEKKTKSALENLSGPVNDPDYSFADVTNDSTKAPSFQERKDQELSRIQGQRKYSDAIEVLGLENNPNVEKLPPLPQKTDTSVSTAMLKLTSMLAAPDAKPPR